MKRLAVWPLALWFACLSLHAGERIEGAWELACMPPAAYIDDTDPRGVLNTKWVFGRDGHVHVLDPDQPATDDPERTASYTVDHGEVTMIFPDRSRRYLRDIDFPDNQTMRVPRSSGGYTVFHRIPSADTLLKPRSLVRLSEGKQERGDECDDHVTYDTHDYSRLPLHERMLGVWEEIMHRNVPDDALPPYGLTNKLYVIKADTITIHDAMRDAGSNKDDVTPYTLKDGVITIDHRQITPSFNQWGQLVLDLDGSPMLLERLSRNTQKPYPSIPVKVIFIGAPADDADKMP